MIVYLDTEFIERGYDKIELISIGLVAENGAEYYAVASDGWDRSHASNWVKENVLPFVADGPFRSREQIAEDIRAFVGIDPEFWAYYADYDWVLLCQLFGTMMDLPKGWPLFCRDLIQLCKDKGNPKLPKQRSDAEHHALADARHNKVMHDFLRGLLWLD
jgi:hypothetical protein